MVWWVLFFSVSCYCLVVDVVYFKKHQSLTTLVWVSDIVSTLTALFLCFVGFFCGKEGQSRLLQEPLLNGSDASIKKYTLGFFRVQQAEFRARAALVEKIYCKCLKISGQSKQGEASGEIINYMGVDAERIGGFCEYMHDPWMFLIKVGPFLKDININVSRGPSGAGKSSLLSCILGEMPKVSGSIKANVAQSPWIQSGKIEENILFGKEMQREKYDS